jgi:hypothetical protein
MVQSYELFLKQTRKIPKTYKKFLGVNRTLGFKFKYYNHDRYVYDYHIFDKMFVGMKI